MTSGDNADSGESNSEEDEEKDETVSYENQLGDDEREETREKTQQDSFGYSVKGEWGQVVEFGEAVADALNRGNVNMETRHEWETWRPRKHEEDDEMIEKTVEKAKMEDTETRKKEQQLDENGKIDDEAKEEIEKEDDKPVEDAGRDVARKVEDWVYRKITKVNPLYFDTKDFNATLEKASSIGEKVKQAVGVEENDEQEYKLTIKGFSDDVEEALDKEFHDEYGDD
ncbi:MAG: hypothetical protein ABEK59_07665 [Halobacteria archaeon]